MDALTVRERLRAIVEPLRELAAEIDAEIMAHAEELERLREFRRQLDGMLKRANGNAPKPGPKPAPTPETSDALVETVRAFIARNGAVDRDGFTVTALARALKEDADARGVPANHAKKRVGPNGVRRALDVMHANGELRLLKKRVKGGGRLYRDLRPRS